MPTTTPPTCGRIVHVFSRDGLFKSGVDHRPAIVNNYQPGTDVVSLRPFYDLDHDRFADGKIPQMTGVRLYDAMTPAQRDQHRAERHDEFWAEWPARTEGVQIMNVAGQASAPAVKPSSPPAAAGKRTGPAPGSPTEL